MNIIERIDRPCEYVEVAQTALIACQYLYLWLFAGPDDAYKVYSLAILMAFEFVMVHSGLFMAAMPLKASIRLFIPLYGLFAFAFGHSMREGDYTIIILYLATVLNRMRFAFFNVSKSVKQRVVRQSMIALAVYFVLTVSVVCAESVIPSFSLGAAFSESASYTREVRAGGLFVEKALCTNMSRISVLQCTFFFLISKTVWRERAFIKRRCTGGYTEEVTNKRQQKNK